MKRVFLVGDERKGEARSLARSLEQWIRRRAKLAGVDLGGTEDLSRVKADLVLVLGGDGSILSAARRLGANQVPTLGVNLGRLGFLAALSPETAAAALQQVLSGSYTVEERLMLRCLVRRQGKVVFNALALNDALVARETHSRMITVEVAVGYRQVIDYRCDGIVVATPTGATGYSLSAGGPILDPGLRAFAVTPICPHTLTNRPLVVPSADRLILRLSDVADRGIFSADGQVSRPIGKNDLVELAEAKEKFRLVSVKGGDFYSRLHTVLGWRGKMEPRPS